MELISKFANLANTLSEKFPEIKNTVYLYLLAFVVVQKDDGNTSFFLRADIKTTGFYGIIIPQFFDQIKKYNSVDITKLSYEEFKELVGYLIEKCKDILKNFPLTQKTSRQFLADLAKNKPQVIQKVEPVDKRFTEGYTYSFSNFSDTELKEYSDIVISEALNKAEKQYLYIPKALEITLAKIANPKPYKRIFSPTCGIGSIFVELQKQYPTYDLDFAGTVDNPFFYLLCLANLQANGIEANIIYDNPIYEPTLEEVYWEDALLDVAIAVLPFRMKVGEEELDKEFFSDSRKMTNAEFAFVELMFRNLNENGKAIVVVSENFLFSQQGKSFRDKYIQNDWIERVISLSQATFKPDSIKTSIVVFNKNKAEKGVVFFDGRDSKNPSKFVETKVSISQLKSDNKIDLRATRYALSSGKELASILSKYPQNQVKKIKDLIVSSISGYNYSPNDRVVENSSKTLPYVRVTDLSKDDENFNLNISKVERKISREKVHKKTLVDFSAILVSKIAPKLKPTYFNFTGQPIVIGSDVIALKLKENVNPQYFLTQLYSRLVQIQVEERRVGATINRISTQDFLDIRIFLPSPKEQERQVLEMRGVIAEKVAAEEKVIEAQYEVVANINHSLKNKLAVIINDYDTLVRFLRRKERNNETIRFANPISANAVGDDIDTIEIITERLRTNLLDASKVFKNAEKIQKQTLNKEVVELVRFFIDEIKPLYIGKNYTIEVIAKPNLKLNVWLDKDAFKDVIENLIENAKCHGFIDDERNYRVVFELSKLEEPDEVDEKTSTKFARIIYKNDGKPFPKNFSFEDYKQFSNKAGKTQGTGIGGYVINKMIELHDGRFNFISPSDDFTVEFEILLPLEN